MADGADGGSGRVRNSVNHLAGGSEFFRVYAARHSGSLGSIDVARVLFDHRHRDASRIRARLLPLFVLSVDARPFANGELLPVRLPIETCVED